MALNPWQIAPPPAWEAPQGLFDRIVQIRRPIRQTAVGSQGYGGLSPIQETVVFPAIPANISFAAKVKGASAAGLPGDVTKSEWVVTLPNGYAGAGQIVERDVVEDDEGRRFQVVGAWGHILGWTLRSELLEA
jgi:hypothetical protein